MAHKYDRIFAMQDEGRSISEIAENIGMDRRKVTSILGSIRQEKEYLPYSLTDQSKWPEIKNRIIEMHKENKEVTTKDIIKEVKETFGEEIGYYGVAHVREEANLIYKAKKYGHFVREPNRDKRVDWARRMIESKEMFTNVFFVDEASVEIVNETGHVWVSSDDPYGHISMRPKHPQRVMIWIGISMMGPTEVKVLGPKESLKKEDYVRILEEFYVPAATKLYGRVEKCRLAQDNAAVHTAAYTREKMAEMKVQMLPWPAESPDMMPVELVFAYMKERLGAYYKPKSKAELIESIHKFKEKFLTKEYCQRTIRHIHTAMKQVVRKVGHPVRGKKD